MSEMLPGVDWDDFEEPRIEALGEQPVMTAEEWRLIADQMHDEGNWAAMDEADRKAALAERHGMVGSAAWQLYLSYTRDV